MYSVRNGFGSFNYEDQIETAGLTVVRAYSEGRQPPQVWSEDTGHDVTTLAVEMAFGALQAMGRSRNPRPRLPDHLRLERPDDEPVKSFRKVIERRADWELAVDLRDQQRRAEWRALHDAARAYLLEHDVEV